MICLQCTQELCPTSLLFWVLLRLFSGLGTSPQISLLGSYLHTVFRFIILPSKFSFRSHPPSESPTVPPQHDSTSHPLRFLSFFLYRTFHRLSNYTFIVFLFIESLPLPARKPNEFGDLWCARRFISST